MEGKRVEAAGVEPSGTCGRPSVANGSRPLTPPGVESAVMRLVLVLLLVAACGGGGDAGGDQDGGGEPTECEPSAGSTPASGVVRVGGTSGVWSNGPSIDGVLSTGRNWQWFGLAPQLQVETARAGACVLYE